MQWDSSPGNAGFSPDAELKPWLPVSSNVREINVKDQIADKNSMLSFYKRLLQLRKDYHCLQVGDMSNIFRDEKNCLYYSRNLENQNLGIILNFGRKDISIVNPYQKDTIQLFSTIDYKENQREVNIFDSLLLHKYEGIVLQYS